MTSVRGAVLLARDGDVLVERYAGLADTGTMAPCWSGTRFQIASISKQITAAAVLLLSERKALHLDDRIGRWIGRCPDSWSGMTLHHLLTHTSGLGHWPDHPMIELTEWLDPADAVAAFQSVPPLFAPGDGWRYSSPGYVLLAQVVQRAADEPYREFLDRAVFGPMGMADSFAGGPAGRDRLARGHVDEREVASFELDSLGMGTGDVWSTARDMLAWVDGLRDDRLLGEAARRLMFATHAATGGGPEASGYGYGWFTGALGGGPWFHHDGHNAGFKAFLGWLPASDRRLVVLTNQEEVEQSLIRDLLSG